MITCCWGEAAGHVEVYRLCCWPVLARRWDLREGTSICVCTWSLILKSLHPHANTTLSDHVVWLMNGIGRATGAQSGIASRRGLLFEERAGASPSSLPEFHQNKGWKAYLPSALPQHPRSVKREFKRGARTFGLPGVESFPAPRLCSTLHACCHTLSREQARVARAACFHTAATCGWMGPVCTRVDRQALP